MVDSLLNTCRSPTDEPVRPNAYSVFVITEPLTAINRRMYRVALGNPGVQTCPRGRLLTGPHAFGPKKYTRYISDKILMKQPHDCVATSQWEGGPMELY